MCMIRIDCRKLYLRVEEKTKQPTFKCICAVIVSKISFYIYHVPMFKTSKNKVQHCIYVKQYLFLPTTHKNCLPGGMYTT